MRKVLLTILGIILALLILVPGGGYLFLRRSLPQVNGTVKVQGVQGAVEIVRDADGVPYIYAQTDLDAMFGLGYVHAQDRLWQMEFQRRVGAGRLSEVLGEATVDTDKFLRTLGTYRAAQQAWEALSPQAQQVVNAYVAGVNAYLAAKPALPIEFTILGFTPAPWQPVDCMVWAKMMAWNLGGDYDAELVRAQIYQALGEARAAQLFPTYPSNGTLIVPNLGQSAGALAHLSTGVRAMLGADALNIGSNNWVVSGARTTTGKPLLANDPHLGAQIPSIWYLASIQGNRLHVIGATLPGMPGVPTGHNDRVAWGVTNLGPDVQDLYMERINPANPNEVEVNGAWQPLTVISETIQVKGRKEPIFWAARASRHGPLISDVTSDATTTLALRWTALDAGDTTIEAFLGVMYAANWDEFRNALRAYVTPSQNFVYADVDGNIGYYGPGRIPIRKQGNGFMPVPGWNDDYAWTGFIPFDDLPHDFNPASGYIATANNKVVPDAYPYFLATDWAPRYRAARIVEMIEAKPKLSPDDIAAMQADQKSLQALELLPFFLQTPTETPQEAQALDLLKNWDGVMRQDSAAAAIYAAWLLHLQPALLQDDLGKTLGADYLASFHPTYLLQTLSEANSPWCDNVLTPAREDCRATQHVALQEALKDLTARMGSSDLKTWRWDKVHVTEFPHNPFDQVSALKNIFSRQIPNGGDGSTVNVGPFRPSQPFVQRHVPSIRQISDLSDWNSSRFMHTTGQSGNVLSNHYDDLIARWQKVEYLPMVFDRDKVKAVSTLQLQP